MLSVKKLIFIGCVLMLLSCNLVTGALPAPAGPTPTVTSAPAATETPNPPALAPSETPAPALTSTPAPTSTATLDSASATQAAGMGSMGVLMGGSLQEYANPVGIPLKDWHGVPILAQATAGQEFSANIYSYKAAASLDQALQFYKSKTTSLGLMNLPATGHGGTGSLASHSASFLSFKVSIIITSYDNDTGHVIVVIATAP